MMLAANARRIWLGVAIVLAALATTRAFLRTSGDRQEPITVRPEAVAFRHSPLRIRPVRDFSGMVPRTELRHILRLTEPRWSIHKQSDMLHALRLWGDRAVFDGDVSPGESYVPNPFMNQIPSGGEMLDCFLNNDEADRAGVVPRQSLYRTEYGIGVTYASVPGSIGHCDQYLKTMAEISISSSARVVVSREDIGTLSDVLTDSLARFRIEQELEFSAIAYAHWLPPTDRWKNRFGDAIDLDRICNRLVERPLGKGACFGMHVPYAIIKMIRADEDFHFLKPETLGAARWRLKQISDALESSQSPNGAWHERWWDSREPDPETSVALQGIYATGHHLEWIAYAPEGLRPDRTSVRRAIRYLSKSIPLNTVTTISATYGPYSHAARALCLLENVEPADLIRPDPQVNQDDACQ